VRSAIELWLRQADVEDPERTAGLLAASIGAADVEGIDPSAVFEAWRTAIETAALSGPLVVVFEDLHWSSDPLLDLVDFVLQPRGDLPLLMLVLTRPELLDRRPSWGSGRRNYVSLVLDPLPDDLVGRLVGQLLDGAPVPVVEAIVARADGNPFYAGELVRSLVDHVGPSPDPATIESALGSLPDSVQGAVLARLDVLAPAARRVLQVGSVFGRAFRAAGVAAVDETLADTVGTACDALVERDLIRPAASGFAFRHILIREVAYGTLPRAERARLHDAAGRWIESASTGTVHAYAELIAFHAREAANLARLLDLDEAEALTARAIDWLRRAGEAAMAAAANVEALRHYRSGAELARGSDLLDLELRIGETRVDGATSAEAYERALALASAGDVPAETRLRALTGILELYTRQQGSVPRRPTPERLEGLFAEARELATDPAVSERARAGLLVAEGFRPFWYRSYAERVVAPDELAASREKVARAADIARRLDDPRLLSAALDAIGSLDRDEGGFRASLAFAEQRIAFQDRLPLDERIDAYAVSIWDSAVLGDFDEADERARAILAQVQPGQLPSWVLHVRAWQAYALLLAGRWDEAVDTMGRGRQLWIDVGRPAAGYALRGFVAASDVAIARRDGVAQAEWREVMQGIADQFERSTPVQRLRQAYARGDLDDMARELAVSHTWTGSPDLVERTVSRLADSGRSVDEGRLTAILQNPALREAQVLAGQLHRAIGMGRQEPEPYRRALEVFDRLGAEPCAARVRCELALLTGEAEILQAGLAALERLGDVERIAAYERQARQRGLAGG
jgi:hypothetical protein